MAHFAKLGANGKVIQVLTLDNKDMLNAMADRDWETKCAIMFLLIY